MQMEEIKINSRVVLKNGFDDVYLYAVVGSEGWVRERKIDGDGFSLVKIEWDKNHWRYNGQADGWTYENHFDTTTEPVRQTEEELPVDIEEEVALLANIDTEKVTMESQEELAEAFMDNLSESFEAATEAEAFIMFTVQKKINPETGEAMYAPTVHTESMSDEARVLLEIQIAEYATQIFQETLYNVLRDVFQGRDPDGINE